MNATDTPTRIAQHIARNVDTTGYDINVTLNSNDHRREAGTITITHDGATIWSATCSDVVGFSAFAVAAIRDHQAA